MTDSYTKLFASITESTIWAEPASTRLVWITMLAKCNRDGEMFASVPGLAKLANVGLGECEAALAALQAPDQWSRTKSDEGRRIEEIDGGWRLINHGKYRDARSTDERREYMAEYMRKYRVNNKKANNIDECGNVNSYVNTSKQPYAPVSPSAPAPALAPEESKASTLRVEGKTADAVVAVNGHSVACPIQEIVSLYHAILPELPKIQKLTKTRIGLIQQRWREDLESMDDWKAYLSDVRASPFLMGKVNGREGQPPFRADLEWLCRPSNFAKVYEGKYHR